jgi:4-amino-4-deoxy-L-arabinose transferase-like glycosyltransferase
LRQLLVKTINHRLFIPVCLFSGLLLRLLWIWLISPEQVSDFKWYLDRSISIANGTGYSKDGHLTAYWPVGYPAFLGFVFYVFGPSVLLAKLINVALSMGIAILAYSLSRDIFHSESSARIALFILCFYPNHIAYNSFLASEMFFTFMVLLGAFLFIRASGRFALLFPAGLAWGLAALTKPQIAFFPLIFVVVFSRNIRTALKSTVVVYLAISACLLPWMIRNYRVLGKPLLSTNGGIVLMQGNSPYATGKHIWDENVESMVSDLHTATNLTVPREVAIEARARKIGASYIVHHPVRTILLWPQKFFYMYRSDVDGFFYSMGMLPLTPHQRVVYLLLRIFAECYYFVVIGLALFSLPRVLRNKPGSYRIGIYAICYFTAVCLVFFGNARYHYPAIPWLVLYAGIGAALLLGLWPKSDNGGELPAVGH